ncbi:MAG: SRPBCC family protein [Bacteroidota bacterium]
MPQQVEIKESILIEIPIDKLWEITALQFDKIGDWSSGVLSSKGHGVSELGAVCLERQCEPSYKGFKKTTERIVDYHPENHQFTYKIVSGLPAMVQNATNSWTHIGNENQTRITMDVNMELKGLLGWLMKNPMKKQMRKILRENLEELKYYAETGRVYDRKKS